MRKYVQPLTHWQKVSSVLLFLMGTFGSTQIYLMGCIGISELVVFAIAPYLFLKNYATLKKDGFIPFITLIFINMISCAATSFYHGVWPVAILKGEMALYSMFALTVVYHKLLKGNIQGIRWFLLGNVVSGVIKTFAFNPKVSVSSTNAIMIEDQDLETKMSHPLFWMGRLGSVIEAVVCGWYYRLPILIGYVMLFIYASILVKITVSGRSAIGLTFAGLLLLTLAGKHNSGLVKIRKYLAVVLVGMFAAAVAVKGVYGRMAESGVLGEDARNKYEFQTRSGSGIMDYLRSGRAEFFIGLSAIVDHPIIGFGVIPIDEKGYVLNYYEKYATQEDFERLIRYNGYCDAEGYRLIPSHSHIIGSWIYNGLPGLVLWIYVLILIFMYFKKYISAVPQLFPYLCFATPSMLWHIFFSPYGRLMFPLYATGLLLSRAAFRGRPVSDPVDTGLIEEMKR